MTTSAQREYNKIIWAINPFDEEDLHKPLVQILKSFQCIENYSLQPIFVMNPSTILLSKRSEVVSSRTVEEFPIRTLKKVAESFNLERVAEPIIVSTEKHSTRSMVLRLLEEAESMQASMIACSTHATKGLKGFFIGSFTETLLHHSEFPVLISNPENLERQSIRHLFYPCDFGLDSKEGFMRALDLADIFQAKLTVFHAEVPAVLYQEFSEFRISGWMPYMQTNHEQTIRDRSSEFFELSQKLGVELELIIQEATKSPREEIIHKLDQLNPDLVVLPAKTYGPLSKFIGSTVRSVTRHAPCPVYIFRLTAQ